MDREKEQLSTDVRKTAQAIAELHPAHHAQSTTSERWVGQAVHYVSRPWFLCLVTIGVVTWIFANSTFVWFGYRGVFEQPRWEGCALSPTPLFPLKEHSRA